MIPVTFPALGAVTVVADQYVPRTISLDDGTRRPYGVRVRSTVFVGPETYAAIAGCSSSFAASTAIPSQPLIACLTEWVIR